MRILIVCFISLVSSVVALAQGVLLQAGQSYVFEFDSVPYLQPVAATNHSMVIAWFAPGTLNPQTTSALLEIYPNNLSDTPLSAATNVFIDEYPSGRLGIAYYWPKSLLDTNSQSPFFADLQGVLRVTMLSGSAELSGFDVSQIIDGDFYSAYLPVPEPSVTTLVIIGVMCLFVGRRIQCKPPNTALEPTADSAFSSASRSMPRVGGGSAFVR